MTPRAVAGGTIVTTALGLAAAAGPALVVVRRRGSRRALAVAAAFLVLAPVAGWLLIGARHYGYPRSVAEETLERDLERQRAR